VEKPAGAKYTPLRHLATGGMAEIHLALTRGIEGFEKLVVVKRILPHLVRETEFVEMFLDEARIAATLHHPNITQVYDIGRDEQSHFFTMEFVHGSDLSNVLRRAADQRRPPPLDQAIAIVLGMCAGLHYAHEKEGLDGKPLAMVHRDVSPQNVLISFDGAVKLVDFGIAKAAARSGVTKDGSLKGKIAYMSPEQCRSKPLDRRSDIFSLSIVLWELTTFRRLFRQPSDYEMLTAITSTDAPPPSQFRPDYPPQLERIVMKGLRRDPALRYQNAEEMQLDLEELAREYRLVTSSVALGRFMRSLFRDQAEAWAKAQAEGQTFPKFLATCEMPQPSTTTDTWVAPSSDELAVPSDYVPGRDTPPPFAVPSHFPRAPSLLPLSERSGAIPVASTPAARSRRPLLIALVALGLIAGAIAVVVAKRGGDARADHAAPPPTPLAADAASAPAVVMDAAVEPADETPPVDAAVMPAPVDAGVVPIDAGKRRRTTQTTPKPGDNGLDDILPH